MLKIFALCLIVVSSCCREDTNAMAHERRSESDGEIREKKVRYLGRRGCTNTPFKSEFPLRCSGVATSSRRFCFLAIHPSAPHAQRPTHTHVRVSYRSKKFERGLGNSKMSFFPPAVSYSTISLGIPAKLPHQNSYYVHISSRSAN